MKDNHTREFKKMLKGKTIDTVRRLDSVEMEGLGWYSNPLVLVFKDGTQLIFQCDDEGNDGGAAMYYDGEKEIMETIYTIR